MEEEGVKISDRKLIDFYMSLKKPLGLDYERLKENFNEKFKEKFMVNKFS